MVTGEMVEELILSGADIIKVGVGPGKTCWECSTRVQGFGRLEMAGRESLKGPSPSLKHISFGTVLKVSRNS